MRFEVNVLGAKSDMIIEYIERLPEGARVSVRGLSKELGVSEGTAFKAIRLADERGLVETRPRAGTVRKHKVRLPSSLAAEARRLGLEVLAGADNMDVPITRLVLGDCSVQQLADEVRGGSRGVLCVVGDRPDIFAFAVQRGMCLLVTGGIHPGEAVLKEAEKNGGCVLASGHDSFSVLRQMSTGQDNVLGRDFALAGDWMRTPPYLYYNDIVADWHSIYRPIFSLCSRCAVVDDELSICGTVDAIRALGSAHSRKISSLYLDDCTCFTADEDTPIDELAGRMIAEGSAAAYITRDGTLRGVITSNDLLRYYRSRPSAASATPRLELVEAPGKSGRSVYSTRLTESGCSGFLPVLLEAAKQHCASLGYTASFENGSFYSLGGGEASGDLMVSCEQLRSVKNGVALYVEIYDEATRYAGCVLSAVFIAE